MTDDPRRPDDGVRARTVAARWGGHEILARSFVAVPIHFLRNFSTIKPYGLTPTEAMFILQLMIYKWDERAPFPGYKTIAQQMGVSETYARKLGRTLEKKGYIARKFRIGATNEFDLTPLFDRLAEHALATDRTPTKE